MRELVDILGVKINRVDMGQASDMVIDFLEGEERGKMIFTPNSEMIVLAVNDPQFMKILNQADLCIPDGAGVLLASRILQDPLPERVAGFDLMMSLIGLIGDRHSLYLLGGRPGIVDKVCRRLTQEYPGINICGAHHGYLDEEQKGIVIQEINSLSPDLLLVGMGMRRQEEFIFLNREQLNMKAAMAVGGAFDVLAGELNRAPYWLQRFHLEWLYRLYQEPTRLSRMSALPRFVGMVLEERIKRIRR